MVVSPFLDRSHGTEQCVIEQIEWLAANQGWEVHLYSQRVEDVEGLHVDSGKGPGGRIFWHRISEIPGPHFFKFIWWFLANHFRRWRDARYPHLRPNVIYSPGINCMDADAISVHIVFHEFYLQVRSELRLSHTPILSWGRAIHRKMYYRLIMALERKIYSNPRVRLAAVSQLVADKLLNHFHRSDVAIIPNGVDTTRFSPGGRLDRRAEARKSLQFDEADFVLLLIGNDWKNKGLDLLLRAMMFLKELPFRLLVVGSDNPQLYGSVLSKNCLQDRVRFEAPRRDVLHFYAAADAYVGPSREDAFGLPVLEAMACGLPVIASARAGVSQGIEDGKTGLILQHPEDSEELVILLKRLFLDKTLQVELGNAASEAAKKLGWETNAAKTLEFLIETARGRQAPSPDLK